MTSETVLCLFCMLQVPIATTVIVGHHEKTKRPYRLCRDCFGGDAGSDGEESEEETQKAIKVMIA